MISQANQMPGAPYFPSIRLRSKSNKQEKNKTVFFGFCFWLDCSGFAMKSLSNIAMNLKGPSSCELEGPSPTHLVTAT